MSSTIKYSLSLCLQRISLMTVDFGENAQTGTSEGLNYKVLQYSYVLNI